MFVCIYWIAIVDDESRRSHRLRRPADNNRAVRRAIDPPRPGRGVRALGSVNVHAVVGRRSRPPSVLRLYLALLHLLCVWVRRSARGRFADMYADSYLPRRLPTNVF